MDLRDSLGSQLSLTEELQDNEKPCFKKQSIKDTIEMMVGGRPNSGTWACTKTHKGFYQRFKRQTRGKGRCDMPTPCPENSWRGTKQPKLVCWCMPTILAPGRQRKENYEF